MRRCVADAGVVSAPERLLLGTVILCIDTSRCDGGKLQFKDGTDMEWVCSSPWANGGLALEAFAAAAAEYRLIYALKLAEAQPLEYRALQSFTRITATRNRKYQVLLPGAFGDL